MGWAVWGGLVATIVALALPDAAAQIGRAPVGMTPPPEPLSVSEMAERFRPAVVSITTKTGDKGKSRKGTGFVIDESGVVATCLHLLDGAHSMMVRTLEKRYTQVYVRDFDAEHDLAVLQLDAKDLPTLELGTSEDLATGSALTVIANPSGLTRTVTRGVLSGRRTTWDADARADDEDEEFRETPLVWGMPGVELLQISAQATAGSSGAPVFDPFGKVVGVLCSGVDVLDIKMAVPVEALLPLREPNRALDLDDFQELADRQRAEFAEPYLADARLALALEEMDLAAEHLAKALSIDPRSAEALLLQAELLRNEQDLDGAEEAVLEATRLDPESAEAWYQLGATYLMPALEAPLLRVEAMAGVAVIGERPREKAEDALEKALELDDQHAEAALGLGTIWMTEGRNRDAVEMFERALESDPDLVMAGLRLAATQRRLGEDREAEQTYDSILYRDSDNALANLGMARLLFDRTDLVRSRRYWQRFIELSEDDPTLEAERERVVRFLERNMPEALP